MIRLASETISSAAQDRLNYLQRQVDEQADFEQKASRADSLWRNKSGSETGKAAFDEIRNTLIKMCISVEVCNYCEQNEANDIEHIYPKSLFPEKAFVWENYLLACKQCNTAYKLDSFAVLDGQDNLIDLARGVEPPNQRGAFINPRIEDPSSFMLINPESFTFEILPGLAKADEHKAVKTCEILSLNERDELIVARKVAAQYFYHRLEMLSRILNANSIAAIEQILSPYDRYLDDNLSVEELKSTIKEAFKQDIQKHQHPSVWYSVKVIESQMDVKWKTLFEIIPEALQW